MDAGAYQAAGLYDPSADSAADRLALLEWLSARGITIEQMVRAHRVSSSELREVVERFEETAHDVVTVGGGRLVKLIGDEVMFITVEPASACEIALTLVERFASDTSVTPRGGIAVGDLLVRGGDYYGPIVNLAARVAQLAVPSEMLVTPDVAAGATGAALRFEPAGKRMVKELDEPVSLLTVERG